MEEAKMAFIHDDVEAVAVAELPPTPTPVAATAATSIASLSRLKRPPPPPPPRIIKAKAETVLMVLDAFKQPYKQGRAYLIPKDRAAWLEYWLYMVKKTVKVRYLSDKELKKVIQRAKPNLVRKLPPIVRDRDLPDCVYWTQEEVANWVEAVGYPHLKNAFLENCISGRKLVHVDASALNRMGLQDFKQIVDLATRIRKLLQLHCPNISMIQAIGRQFPYMDFLKMHSKSGQTYDGITFQKFCDENGYPYGILRKNKCVLFPCVPAKPEDSDDERSLEGAAPSVEYIVRHQIIRNRAIQRIFDEVLSRIFDPTRKPTRRESLEAMIRRILEEAMLELGFGDPSLYTRERLEFAASVAERLLREMMNTATVLNDIKAFEERLKSEIEADHLKPEDIERMRDAAVKFIEDVAPISVMLALDEFSLETIFKQQPEFEEYVQSIVDEAETKTNEFVPEAEELVHDILSEAKLQVMAQDEFPNMSLDSVRSAKEMAQVIIQDVLENAMKAVGEREIIG